MSIRFRVDEWPFVITEIENAIDEADTQAYLDRFLADVIGRKAPFVSIVDATRMRHAPSARVRRIIADWEQQHDAIGIQYNRGVAFVTDSALIRGAMTALHWISPPKIPTTFEATMAAAREWASKRIELSGVVAAARR